MRSYIFSEEIPCGSILVNDQGRLNNTKDTTDATDGQNRRRLKRIEIRVFENCSA